MELQRYDGNPILSPNPANESISQKLEQARR
jgi:hypothetical protein